ncbi:Rab3 GTPase-activating protein regulatory subunit N-terminus-domain-containing protein, partial [Dimargaris cristalligena]
MTQRSDQVHLVLEGLVPLAAVADRLHLPRLDDALLLSPFSPATQSTHSSDDLDAPASRPTSPLGDLPRKTVPQFGPAFDLRVAKLSVSFRSEYLAIATEGRYALLNTQPPSRFVQDGFRVVSFGPELADEHITAIFCLPFYQPSGRMGPTDVVVAVGYSNGGFRIFSQDGHLLISQRLHSMPLIKIKFRPAKPDDPFLASPFETWRSPSTTKHRSGSASYRAGSSPSSRRSSIHLDTYAPPAPGSTAQAGSPTTNNGRPPMGGHIEEDDDELLLVFADGQVVTILGKSLWIAIRICIGELGNTNTNLALGTALTQPVALSAGSSFSYRKFVLGNPQRQVMRDVISCGPSWRGRHHDPPSAVRTLLNQQGASPGQVASFNPALLTATARFVAVGSAPMVGLYSTNKATSVSHSMTSMASTIASKMSSAVYALARNYWWGGAADVPQEHTPPMPDPAMMGPAGKFLTYDYGAGDAELEGTAGWTAPTALNMVAQIADSQRQISQIVQAPPEYQLGVMTDNFGRVMLIDLLNLEIIRLWKGLRECQCGWIETLVDENDLREASWATGPTSQTVGRSRPSSMIGTPFTSPHGPPPPGAEFPTTGTRSPRPPLPWAIPSKGDSDGSTE